MKKSTAELWVKIIAILGYITAALSVIGGIFLFFGGTFLSAVMPFFGEDIIGSALVGTLMVVLAIVAIIFGVVTFIIALNLWKFKNWARIVEIIFAAIGILSSLPSLFTGKGIIGLVINAGIFYLLAINKDVRKLFK